MDLENDILKNLKNDYLTLVDQYTQLGENLNRRIKELESKNDSLEEELRVIKSKSYQITPDTLKRSSATFPMNLYNNMEDFIRPKGEDNGY